MQLIIYNVKSFMLWLKQRKNLTFFAPVARWVPEIYNFSNSALLGSSNGLCTLNIQISVAIWYFLRPRLNLSGIELLGPCSRFIPQVYCLTLSIYSPRNQNLNLLVRIKFLNLFLYA